MAHSTSSRHEARAGSPRTPSSERGSAGRAMESSENGQNLGVHENQSLSLDKNAMKQLVAIGELHEWLEQKGLDHWLFGGWAVDFHAGRTTRPHRDIDLAVWLKDVPEIADVLADTGWVHKPSPRDNGGTRFVRGPVPVDLTFLVREDDGVWLPLADGPSPWPKELLEVDVLALAGKRCRVMALAPLRRMKSNTREDPEDGARDAADHRILCQLRS